MRRNIVGLKRSALLRSENATARATAALQRIEAADQEINFRIVAAEARVSTAWLYTQPELRARIMCLRNSPRAEPAPSSPSRDRERLSRENIVAALRLRIRTLEEKNLELTGLLEVAYGELTLLRERQNSARRLHVNDVPRRSSTKKSVANYR